VKLALTIIGAAFVFVVVTVVIALSPSDRLGLEHTMYLYRNLIER
jgi:hypothetical protein